MGILSQIWFLEHLLHDRVLRRMDVVRGAGDQCEVTTFLAESKEPQGKSKEQPGVGQDTSHHPGLAPLPPVSSHTSTRQAFLKPDWH